MDISLIFLGFAVLIAAALLAFVIARGRAKPAELPPPDTRLDSVIAQQGAISERFQQTVEAQSALQKVLAERLDALNKRLGDSLHESAEKTAATIGSIGERLTVIDEAQKNISALSSQVVGLQEILSNKQSRGAFGQAQMETIIADMLPNGAYEFQFKLSNSSRPDCVIKLPGNKTYLIIDSKFPLEGFEALKKAASDDERKFAVARVRTDVIKHINDIAGKYLIPGETQSPALMFVPSESIYAELHDGFTDVIQKAHRAQVVVVSPNILMLAINTMQTVMKDARMREQASQIQKEVGALVKDVERLGERVSKLQSHFNQADGDIKNILISTDKILSRGEKIEKVELSSPDEPKALPGS